MKRLHILLFTFLAIGFLVVLNRVPTSVHAETDAEKASRLSQQIEQYQNEIKRLSSQATTLGNQIAQYDAQIKLTELKINQIEEKIGQLSGRIDQLGTSIQSLTHAFEERAVQTYKMSRFSEAYFLLSANDLDSMVSSYHYLQRIHEEDRSLVHRLSDAQDNYKKEKTEQEDLQDQLMDQRKTLDSQKIAKGKLLDQTKNDEKRYQSLLAATQSEFDAIQAILAGKGQETEVGPVSKGSKIASIIQGPSCNSSGAHLHFIVGKDGVTQSPFSYLKSGIDSENCSGSSCGSGNGDPFNPSGSWDWPISPKITFTQGYGTTWAVRNTYIGRIYNFHNGIDIQSPNPDIHAVQSGKLYRGSYGGTNGCRLRYVRVHHDGDGFDTFYLHINY
jgi:peptidoglycan hydrolase CwlO-like protein